MGLFTPRKIGLPNEDKIQQIIYKIDDVNQMKGKEVTILGGGDSAVDYALLLKDIAQKVNIVHRRNDFRAQSNSVTQMENSSSINIKLNKNILSANTKEDKVLLEIEDNVTKNKEIITSDYVFVQYGQQASKDEFNIEKNNNLIVVNTYYMTSMENVFACGNIITYPGKVKNITSGLGEVATAIIKIDQIINPNKNIPVHF
jgi:thioredoxin reductase (NADPH)